MYYYDEEAIKSLIQVSCTEGGRFELLQEKQEGREDADLAKEWAMPLASLWTQQNEQEGNSKARTLMI